jgi:hypothetical protein
MSSNVSLLERFLRVVLGLFMGLGPLFGTAAIFDKATVSIVIILIGVVLFVTGLIGIFPVFRILRLKKDRLC